MSLIKKTYVASCHFTRFCALLICVLASHLTLAKSEGILISADAAKKMLDRNVISVAAAERIAKNCVAYAENVGKRVAVYILSPSGTVTYAYGMDGQIKPVVESAYRKAQSELDTRMPTRVLESFPANMHPGLYELGQFPYRGGLPIMLGEQMIGAIGVGGMSGEEDEACAHQAVTAVVGQQPPLISDQ